MKPQLRLLIGHFKSGQTLTVLTALHKYGIYDLRSRMSEIRKMCGVPWIDEEGLGYWEVYDNWLELDSGKRVKSFGMRRIT